MNNNAKINEIACNSHLSRSLFVPEAIVGNATIIFPPSWGINLYLSILQRKISICLSV